MHDIYQMMEIVSPTDFVFARAFWDFGMPGQPLALAANGIEKWNFSSTENGPIHEDEKFEPLKIYLSTGWS